VARRISLVSVHNTPRESKAFAGVGCLLAWCLTRQRCPHSPKILAGVHTVCRPVGIHGLGQAALHSSSCTTSHYGRALRGAMTAEVRWWDSPHH
jgi:hypothetical protein